MTKDLEDKVKSGTLEAEDILAIARYVPPPKAADLQGLRPLLAARGEPGLLGKWLDVVEVFLDGGYGALSDYLNEATRPFVYGLVEELRTTEGLEVLIRDGRKDSSVALAPAFINTVNLVLSFPDAPRVDPGTLALLREWLHAALEHATTRADLAAAYCALRGVGDSTSLEKLAQMPDLLPPYDGVRKLAMNAIKARLGRA